MKRRILSVIAMLLVLVMLAACGSSPSQTTADNPPANTPSAGDDQTAGSEPAADPAPSPTHENVLNLGLTNFTKTKLDAVWVNRGDLYKTMMFRSLFIATPDLKGVECDMAESYTVSDDKLTYTVVLKDNLLWHDNEPITAEDVKWSVEAALKGTLLNGIYTTAFNRLVGVEEFKAGTADDISGITVDGNTVTFQLSDTSSTFLAVLAQFAILPKHCLENEDLLELHNSDFWEHPIGSGMYKLDEFNPGNYVIYVPFEGYEGDPKPTFEKMVCTGVGDIISAAQNGQIDYFSTSNPEQITQLDQMPHMTKFPVDINYYRYLVCNLEDENGVVNEKIADPRIRKALLMAIDRENILAGLFTGLGSITDTGLPASADEYYAQEAYAYDPDAAKALLEEAGFDFDQTIKLRYYAGDQASASMMEAIAFSWEALGVKVDVAKFQGSSSEELFVIRDYDFSLKALSAFAYEEYYGEYLSSNANFSKILGGADDFDELVMKLSSTDDPKERADILKQLQILEQELLYKMPIGCFGVNIYVNTDKIDVGDAVFGNPYYNYQNSFASWRVK